MNYTRQIGNCPREGCDEAIIVVESVCRTSAYVIDHDKDCLKRPVKKEKK